jgi:AcrR family transcriptional regulator
VTLPALEDTDGARAAEETRRRLTPRQAANITRVIQAAGMEARVHGYEGMSVRSAAKRAGVAPATAYTYFASKDHLLAEVMWRKMEALEPLDHDPDDGALERVRSELEVLGLFMSDDPKLARACTAALLGSGPEVRAVRLRFGQEVHSRLARAIGESADEKLLRGLDLLYTGAMLWSGMGHLPFEAVPGVLAEVAGLLLDGTS